MPDYVAITFVQSLLHGTILHIVLENITELCNWRSAVLWFQRRRFVQIHMHFYFYPRYKISTFLHIPHIREPGLHSQYTEWTEEKRFNSQQGKQIFIFSLFQNVPTSTGTIQWEQIAPSLGVKWPGHETAHSPQSSAKVRNACSYNATLSCAFAACTVTILPFFHM